MNALVQEIPIRWALSHDKILGTKPLFCNGEEELPSLEEEGGFDQGKEASAGGTGRNPVTAGCHVQIEDDILVQNVFGGLCLFIY